MPRGTFMVEVRLSVSQSQAAWLEKKSRINYSSRAAIIRELIDNQMRIEPLPGGSDPNQLLIGGYKE